MSAPAMFDVAQHATDVLLVDLLGRGDSARVFRGCFRGLSFAVKVWSVSTLVRDELLRVLDTLPHVDVTRAELASRPLFALLSDTGAAPSRKQARTVIAGGGCYINGRRETGSFGFGGANVAVAFGSV